MLFTRYLLHKIESGPKFQVGRALRLLGQNILKAGHKLQGNNYIPDKSKLTILII
jgi:hypothetical protein